MARKRKRKPAKVAESGRCRAIVHYVTYPERGIRTERKGRCSRWTIFDCGFCRLHDQIHCLGHRIMWLIKAEYDAKRKVQ